MGGASGLQIGSASSFNRLPKDPERETLNRNKHEDNKSNGCYTSLTTTLGS